MKFVSREELFKQARDKVIVDLASNNHLRLGQALFWVAYQTYREETNKLIEDIPECDPFYDNKKIDQFLTELYKRVTPKAGVDQ